MSKMGKLGWIVSLVLAVGLGAMSYTFLIAGNTVPYADGRTAILLTEDERNSVLAEMRDVLAGVQSIISDTVAGDLADAKETASSMGMAAASADTQIIKKLPLEFKTLGLGLHGSFDDLADVIGGTDDPMVVLDELSNTVMPQCIACHGSYRMGVEGLDN